MITRLIPIILQETSTGAIASAVYYLAQNPDIQTKARAEVLKVLGPLDSPDHQQLKELHYVDACIRETLRCNPPGAFLIPRISSTYSRFGNYNVPPNTFLFVNLYTVLHSRKTFPDPHRFAPERFIKGGITHDTWFPFSRGSRQCPAKLFALCEQKVLLCMLLREYSWRLPENSKHRDGLKNALSSFSATAPHSLEINFTKSNREYISVDNKDGDGMILCEMTSKYSKGLAVASQGLSVCHSAVKDIRPEDLIRGTSKNLSWIDGWDLLAKKYPGSGLHPLLLSDVQACAETYSRVRQGSRAVEYLDVSMTVVGKCDQTSLTSIGPKGLGGHAWQSNNEYKKIQVQWSCPGFSPMPPCVAFTWIALLKKIVPINEIADCIALQLLSTTDYDLDLREEDQKGSSLL